MSDSKLGAIEIKGYGSEFEEFFQKWLKDNKVSVTYNGTYYMGSEPIEFKLFRSTLFMDAKRINKKFNYPEIDACLDIHHGKEKKKYLESIRESIAKPYIQNETISNFIKAITGRKDKMDIAVISHFIWQVKRKLLGLNVVHHMMPVIVGTSGSGKSEAIRRLLDPIGDLKAEKNLDCFKDERHFNVFQDYYVISLDEMGKAESTDIDSMKNIITSRTITCRPLFTNKQISIMNNSTTIGTSNRRISDMIKDPTSARRWYEIESAEKCDWDAINSLNYLELWAGVNALGASPIQCLLDETRAKQEAFRYKTEIEIWTEELGLKKSKEGKMSTSKLYDLYYAWAEENKTKPWSKISFGKQLRSIGFEACFMGSREERARGFYCWAPGIEFEPVQDQLNLNIPPQPNSLAPLSI